MSEKKYSKQHEWVSVEGDVATVGITKHAAEMLGDVVFVELPEKGKMLKKKVKLEWLSLQKQQVMFILH